MNSRINNKFNKSIILIIITIIITIIFIILVLKTLSYARLIIPQLFNDSNSTDYTDRFTAKYITEPVPLSEDSEVIKVLEKAEGLNAQELYELAREMQRREKYKEAYHLYSLMAEKDSDKTLAYAEMAYSYISVLNFEKATEIAEEALTMINELTPLEEQYFAYFTAATIYYYREVCWGFVDSHRTIELLEKTLSIQVNNPEYKEYCEVRNLQMHVFLAELKQSSD